MHRHREFVGAVTDTEQAGGRQIREQAELRQMLDLLPQIICTDHTERLYANRVALDPGRSLEVAAGICRGVLSS
jgi:hypothetical protein